jgi:hypothetical protein
MGGGELGECSPITIDNKHLYLPTEAFLKNSDLREQVAFHPLAEDTLKKRSPVLTAIQNGFNLRLYTSGKISALETRIKELELELEKKEIEISVYKNIINK